MADSVSAKDYLADLTTVPIFDDVVYRREALCLAEDETEDQLDAQLAAAAHTAGIDDANRFLCPDVHDVSTAVSTMTLSSAPRSSMSTHSRETQSTGMTSHPSRTSRDYQFGDGGAMIRPALVPRMSTSSDDSMMARLRYSVRHRTSSSLSGSSSVTPPETPSRKQKRSSGLFSMFRKDSSTCPSNSPHGHYSKSASPRLACGHTLSKYAIRVHIQEALQSKIEIAPNCCGKPLPPSVLGRVLTPKEVAIVTPAASLSPATDSGYSEGSLEIPHARDVSLPRSRTTVVSANAVPRTSVQTLDDKVLLQIQEDAEFRTLEEQRKDQFLRISTFEAHQRKALQVYHQCSLKRLATAFDTAQAEQTRQHALELERLEEFQVVAEHELRTTHAIETQNVATALKYMTAYCAGTNPLALSLSTTTTVNSHPSSPNPNTAITHTVTDDDHKKLARQRATQAKLPAKHSSAINVLRARQEKDTLLKLSKQAAETHQLLTIYERDRRKEEMLYEKEAARLESVIEARRAKVKRRWELRLETWKRAWEKKNGVVLGGQVPCEVWLETGKEEDKRAEEEKERKETARLELDPASSLALYLQFAPG